MITKSKAFLTSDGKVFLTQDEAQHHEIEVLAAADQSDGKATSPISSWIMAHKDEVLAILQTRKPRTPKAAKTKAVRLPRTIQHSETAA